MSVNTAHANGGVLIFNGEVILLYCDGVELHIDGDDAKDFRGNKKGRIYLTSHRMIFTNKSEKDPLQSFSFPFFTMTSINLEQPIFGANYIKGLVTAQPGGNFYGKADFKLKFNTGGAIEFGQAMLQAAKMASRYMPPQPPPYMPSQGPYYPAQPPAYTLPAEGFQGFVPPTHVFPNAPPANSVYTSDMPPPYPGIYPPTQGQAPNQPYNPTPPGYPQTAGYAGGAAQPIGFNIASNGLPPNAPMYNGGAPPSGGMYNGAQPPMAPMYDGTQPPMAPMYNGGPPPSGAMYNGGPPPSGAMYNGPPPSGAMYNGGPPPIAAYNYAGNGMKPMGSAPATFEDPMNPNAVYTYQQNGYNPSANFQEPPPPYFEPQKKNQ